MCQVIDNSDKISRSEVHAQANTVGKGPPFAGLVICPPLFENDALLLQQFERILLELVAALSAPLLDVHERYVQLS